MICNTMSETETKRQTMLKIAKDTVDYFGEDPCKRRAVDEEDGSCMYTTDWGMHCAIGRYMKPEFQTTEFEQNDNASINMLDEQMDHYLRSDVLGLHENFWQKIQDLHDERYCWDMKDGGLTKMGNEKYGYIRIAIQEGQLDNDDQ